MYKVFVNNKPLFLISKGEKTLDVNIKSSQFIDFTSDKDIELAFDYCYSENVVSAVYLVGADTDKLWKHLLKHFIVLEAAGGIVRNNYNELLMIYRFGKWDLPKGKIEKNETPEEAAVREVCEETGVCDIKIISDSKISFHSYIQKNKHYLKKTYWYDMRCLNFSGFRVQVEEGIKDARWMNDASVENALKSSYPSIKEILQAEIRQ